MAKVVVVGAGLAGLCAGVRLAAAGYEVEVLEGRNEIGGRSRSRVVDGVVVELGGQFMSRPHKRMRKLVADAGLHLQRTRLWAGMTRLRRESWATGRLESAAALRDLRALTRIALGSNSLGAVRASAVNDYKSCVQDGRSVREWLGTIGLVGPLRESAETLIGQTFGGANLDEISLLSFAELVGGEGKGLLFLLDGFGLTDYVVEGMGALCAWLADQLASVRLESAVVSVEQDANGVAVQTISGEVIEGDRVIVTVPATILDLISFSPQLPNAIRDAN